MLMTKFNLDDIEKCNTALEVYAVLGIGKSEDSPIKLGDKKVFGESGKPYYKNLFIAEETFDRILEHLRTKGKPVGKQRNSGVTTESYGWSDCGPKALGPRFEELKERVPGNEINRSVLYVLTPEDDMFEEAVDYEGARNS